MVSDVCVRSVGGTIGRRGTGGRGAAINLHNHHWATCPPIPDLLSSFFSSHLLLLKGMSAQLCAHAYVLRRASATVYTGMALRVCWVCGCQEDRAGGGANSTRPNCPNVRGQPCQYEDLFGLHDIPGFTAPYRPTYRSSSLLFGAPYSGSGTSSWLAPHTLTPGSGTTPGAASAGQSSSAPGGGRRASFSFNGTDWFEADDPFASDSGSDGDDAAGPSATSGAGFPTSPLAPDTAAPGPTNGMRTTNYATASTPTRAGAPIPMEIIAVPREGQEGLLLRPCVDCGRRTGSFCDGCLAADRFPDEEWALGQHTPLCTVCDRQHNLCHLCRGLTWAVPPPHGV